MSLSSIVVDVVAVDRGEPLWLADAWCLCRLSGNNNLDMENKRIKGYPHSVWKYSYSSAVWKRFFSHWICANPVCNNLYFIKCVFLSCPTCRPSLYLIPALFQQRPSSCLNGCSTMIQNRVAFAQWSSQSGKTAHDFSKSLKKKMNFTSTNGEDFHVR